MEARCDTSHHVYVFCIHFKLCALVHIADAHIRSHVALNRAAQRMHAHVDRLDSILAVLLNDTVLEVYLSCLLFERSVVSVSLGFIIQHIDALVPVTSLEHLGAVAP